MVCHSKGAAKGSFKTISHASSSICCISCQDWLLRPILQEGRQRSSPETIALRSEAEGKGVYTPGGGSYAARSACSNGKQVGDQSATSHSSAARLLCQMSLEKSDSIKASMASANVCRLSKSAWYWILYEKASVARTWFVCR